MDKFYSKLANPPSHKDMKKRVSPNSIKSVNKLMKCAFNTAKDWELIKKNPFENAILPKVEYGERGILTNDQLIIVLNKCDDPRLSLAINMSFSCTLRIGEILGITWDNVFIDDEYIFNDDAHIIIDKQLQRLSVEALDQRGNDGVIKIFPNKTTGEHKTVLALVDPKTKGSNRKIWLPKTLAYMLQEWRNNQNELKFLLDNEYNDYNLVLCLENGNPCTASVINNAWRHLRKELNIPKNVVFHSFRHMSITYKLKLNKGDIKVTQGDSGHTQANMIMDVYAHIIDEERKVNAQLFNDNFY